MSQSAPRQSEKAPKTVSLDHISLENLSLKIADTEAEISAAQRLRYDVFYKELGAHPIKDMARLERDYDVYDPVCDHLLVIDNNAPKGQNVVGTYRILIADSAAAHGLKLYTETEFDISAIRNKNGRIMEISRSCIAAPYRSKMAINLLWRGIAAFVFGHEIDYLIGTPSFQGTTIQTERDALAYLAAYHMAPQDIRPVVLPEYRHEMPVMEKNDISARRCFAALPPLIKGYLRVGSMIGDGIFIDEQFNTLDVSIVLDMSRIDKKYFHYYHRGEEEPAS